MTDATTYTRVSLADLRPGDEVYQAGAWVPIAAATVRDGYLGLRWLQGGTHSRPISHGLTARRQTPGPRVANLCCGHATCQQIVIDLLTVQG
jgi:hypothetical protein